MDMMKHRQISRNLQRQKASRTNTPGMANYILPGQEVPMGFKQSQAIVPENMYSGLGFPNKFYPGGNEPPNAQGRSGMEFVPQYFRQYPQLAALNLDSDITALKIYKQRSHIYGREIDFKFSTMIMADPPKVKIYEADGRTLDEELTDWMGTMTKRVGLNSKVGMSWSDAYMWYGMSVFNPVFKWNDGVLELIDLVRLPAHLFDVAPADVSWAYSQILQGVVYNPMLKENSGIENIFGLEHELEFWQRQNPFILTPTKLDEKNLFWIRNPNSAEVAGEPIMKPLIPILDMITFFWNCEVQRGNRVGSPTIFFEPVEGKNFEPANERNGNISDMDYLNMIGQNWGKDNVYVTRRSFKINERALDLNRMVSTVMPTIKELWRVLVDAMTPGSFVSDTGTLIGGTGKEAGDAFRSYISGVHGTLSDSWSPLFQFILDENGYGANGPSPKIARLEFPQVASDRADVEQRWGISAPQTKLFEPNEVRAWAHLPPKTDEELQAIVDFWTKLAPIPGTQGLPGMMDMMGPTMPEVPSNITNLNYPTAMHGTRGVTIQQLINETRTIMRSNQKEVLQKELDKLVDNTVKTEKNHNVRTISGAKNYLNGGCSCGHHH